MKRLRAPGGPGIRGAARFLAAARLLPAALLSVFLSCDLYTYGRIGGADQTGTLYPGDPRFGSLMASLSGVWYSRYPGIGRLDGYRIGVWSGFDAAAAGKAALFPDAALPYRTCTAESGSAVPGAGDYFVLYDDTVYGQGGGGGAPQGSGGFSYCGIVRAVNIFNGDRRRGAIIIEYLEGCAPQWDRDVKDGRRPFFGMYYRVLGGGAVQMANAVNLAALHRGGPYGTETAHLAEAVAQNVIENEAEFISWGAVIPQERER